MSMQAVTLECPGCGARVAIDTKVCDHCFQPVVISTFNSVQDMTPLEINKRASAYRKALADAPDNQSINMSIAFCYLKLKLYDKALPCFEKAIEDNFDNSEVYFYAAVTLLKGKKAFLTPRKEIDKAEEYLNAALMIEPKGIYYYFWAYLRYDHHFRKSYRVDPNYVELYKKALQAGLSQTDVKELYAILGVERPNAL